MCTANENVQEKRKGQLVALYKDHAERDRLLEELKNHGFRCAHYHNEAEVDWSKYFRGLPFAVDFAERVFFALNVTCLAGTVTARKEMFTEAEKLIKILHDEARL